MKRFRSKVAALLDLRRRREDQALQDHAKVLHSRQMAQDRVNALSGALNALRLEIRQAMTTGCSASVLSQFHGYGLQLEKDVQEARTGLQRAEKAVAESLQKVLDARRQRESVEKFQARERELHEREALREDQKRLDEIALRRIPNLWSPRPA